MASRQGASVVSIKKEYADEVSALASLLDEGLIVMTHEPDWCACEGTARLTAGCVRATLNASGNTMTPHGVSPVRGFQSRV